MVRDVDRLAWIGVHFVDFVESGVFVQNNSTSSLMSYVKANQGFGLIFVELKEAVFKSLLSISPKWEMLCFDFKVICVFSLLVN